MLNQMALSITIAISAVFAGWYAAPGIFWVVDSTIKYIRGEL